MPLILYIFVIYLGFKSNKVIHNTLKIHVFIMKKFLFSVMAILLLGSFVTGCKGNSQSNATNDSIAKYMGKMQGTIIKEQFQQDKEMSKQFDQDQYIKGMMTVINMDSTKNNRSYVQGLEEGMKLYKELLELENQGISVNRSIYLKEFRAVIEDKDSLDLKKVEKEIEDMRNKLDAFKKTAQQKGQ